MNFICLAYFDSKSTFKAKIDLFLTFTLINFLAQKLQYAETLNFVLVLPMKTRKNPSKVGHFRTGGGFYPATPSFKITSNVLTIFFAFFYVILFHYRVFNGSFSATATCIKHFSARGRDCSTPAPCHALQYVAANTLKNFITNLDKWANGIK